MDNIAIALHPHRTALLLASLTDHCEKINVIYTVQADDHGPE
jgi:hypothetical protein